MPDITMCEGTNCPLKNNCYRHLAEPCEYQSYYMAPVPYNHETKWCDRYWRMQDNVQEDEDDDHSKL